MIELDPMIVGGMYRNLVYADWQQGVYDKCHQSADLVRVKPAEDWRMHYFSRRELEEIPSGTFTDPLDLAELIELAAPDTAPYEMRAPVRGLHIEANIAFIALESEQIKSEREAIARRLLEKLGFDIRERALIDQHPNTSPYAPRIIIAMARSAADYSLLRSVVEPVLPSDVGLQFAKPKLVVPREALAKWRQ